MRNLLLLLALAPSLAAAEAPALTWLRTPEEKQTNFCPTSWSANPNAPCDSWPLDVLLIHFPAAQGAEVASYVNEGFTRGYAQHLSPTDFYHGHLLLRGPDFHFENAASLLANVQLYLFHSEEHVSRWEDEKKAGVPTEKRVARSFVGRNGEVKIAKDWIAPGVRLGPTYENQGTIYLGDIMEGHPELFDYAYQYNVKVPDVVLTVQDGAQTRHCLVDTEFYIVPRAQGAYHTPAGEPYDMFLRCKFNLAP